MVRGANREDEPVDGPGESGPRTVSWTVVPFTGTFTVRGLQPSSTRSDLTRTFIIVSKRNNGGSAKSESGSQNDTDTSPPVANTGVEIGEREDTTAIVDDVKITDDDTTVIYVNAQEPNPSLRPQLIACFRAMWT
uniref:Integrase core domain containing protein n=1 Tax=Solanum tuberosum TaxID=4113 RepID=M1DRU2_SOLTU